MADSDHAPLDPFGRPRPERDIPYERRVKERRRLIDHYEWRVPPPVQIMRDFDTCIALVAKGMGDVTVEVDGEEASAAEAVEKWELEPFVERFRLTDEEYDEQELDEPRSLDLF